MFCLFFLLWIQEAEKSAKTLAIVKEVRRNQDFFLITNFI